MSIPSSEYNPSWTEVILGACLSLLLGAVLAAVFLVLKPVKTVNELPKEPDAAIVYYVEGSRLSSRSQQATAKQRTFLQGGAVTLNEDELNALTAPSTGATKPAAPGAAETPAEGILTAGAPNFRVRQGVLQIGVPMRVSAVGFDQRVIVQARGGFERRGEIFVFEPSELYIGSCPVERLPLVKTLVMKKFLKDAAVPAELAEAWTKLSDVKVEGSALQLTM